MDYRRTIEWHRRKNAEVTIAAIQVPVEQAARFGIVLLDKNHQVTGFEEKPKPGSVECVSGVCNASMGVYLFSTATLIRALTEDAAIENSSHDFGKDILPRLFVAAPLSTITGVGTESDVRRVSVGRVRSAER